VCIMTYQHLINNSCSDEALPMKVSSSHVCMCKHFSGQVATSTTSSSSSSSSPSNERLSMKKFVEKWKGDEHVYESNRRMQRMLEEMLTKHMHLQTNLEQLSLEVVRLSKGTDSNTCT
jgi:hypothetical protein